jgi:hypothetical protein
MGFIGIDAAGCWNIRCIGWGGYIGFPKDPAAPYMLPGIIPCIPGGVGYPDITLYTG